MHSTELIRSKARTLGFSHCGFAKAETMEYLRPFYQGLADPEQNAVVKYLKRYMEHRINPAMLLPGVRSIIALLMNYYPARIIPEEENLILAKYAYGKDYHTVMKKRLQAMVDFLDHTFQGSRTRAFIDSGPVAEKTWAQRCGVGWQGKNTVIINPDIGSFVFIGILFTTLETEPDKPGVDRCSSCTRCVDACPTGALNPPYQLDIDKCLSYQTIENRGEVPENLHGKFHHRIYGCDICQDVCPFNRLSKPNKEAHFNLRPGLLEFRKTDWLKLTEQAFDQIFQHTGVKRTGYKILKRNITIAAETNRKETP